MPVASRIDQCFGLTGRVVNRGGSISERVDFRDRSPSVIVHGRGSIRVRIDYRVNANEARPRFFPPLLADLRKAQDMMTYIFLGVLSLFFVLLPLCLAAGSLLRSLRGHATLRISRDRLHLETRRAIFSGVCDIAANELEGLHIQEADDDEDSSDADEVAARRDRT